MHTEGRDFFCVPFRRAAHRQPCGFRRSAPERKGSYEQNRPFQVPLRRRGKGFYIALALCLAAVGAIGYFTLIRPANVTIDDPTPPARQTERNDAQWTAPVLQPEPIEVPAVEEEPAPEPEDLLPQVVSPLDGTPSRCSAPRN